jgi:two-component system, OmpR family, KDP operon response regulator KdpE
MTRALVVDDDPQLLRTMRINLTAHGYHVDVATNGAQALVMAGNHPPDVVIVDLGLPDMDGVTVVTGLRGWSQVPIVVLSARDDEQAKIAALDAGADDYITKPFGIGELAARLRAALRRGTTPTAPVVTTASFTVDLAAHRVSTANGPVRLTPTEWHLLEVLIRNTGKLVTQRQLLAEIWGPAYTNETNYLRVHLANLRRKLEPNPTRPRHLITEPGQGYRFEP